jgi:hypothetical protein
VRLGYNIGGEASCDLRTTASAASSRKLALVPAVRRRREIVKPARQKTKAARTRDCIANVGE